MTELKDAAFIEVEAGVRYWEDASVNGAPDEDGTLIPFREGDLWRPKINLETGAVVDWPEGMTADVHYKVCDAGTYWLLDANGSRIAKREDNYVPGAFLCHGDNGYGDYIILSIGADGKIASYSRPTPKPEDWELLAA